MFPSSFRIPSFIAAACMACLSFAQDDRVAIASGATASATSVEEAEDLRAITEYDRFNKTIGGDSIRYRHGHPCIGWVEDRRVDGSLKHRGYYDEGRLLLYRNLYPNGQLEREFKQVDNLRSVLRTYHPNGQLATETKYHDGISSSYKEFHPNGRMRYDEVRHRSGAYYERMDLFAEDGTPISTMELVDRKRVEFLLREYHPGGALQSEGRARYNPQRMDTQRIGAWTYMDENGTLVRTEEYVDGKVHTVR